MPKELTSFKQVKRVCLFRLSAIGDILNLIPSLEILLKNYPEVEVTWVIGTGEYNLFRHLANKYPQLKFEVFNKSKTSYWQAFKQLRAMSREPFDLLLHAQTSMRANILSTFIRAKLKVGFSKERSFEGHSLVVDYSIPYQKSMHVMVDYFDLFKPFFTEADCQEFASLVKDTALLYSGEYPANLIKQADLQPMFDLGLGLPNTELALSNVTPQNQNIYKKLVSYSRFAGQDKRQSRLIFVNPASSALKKNWTAEGYISLICNLLDQGHKVVITGGKNQKELNLVNQVVKGVELVFSQDESKVKGTDKLFFNLAGQTTLAELYLFLSLADLVVSPDSGPMHMASCLGIPTVGLFAYINPLRSGPIQGVADVVSVFHLNTYGKDIEFTQEQYLKDLKNWRKKPPKGGEKLMEQITAEQVITRVNEVLARQLPN
ncbi:hypothetical protein CKF54_04300 [Psittacicella hinzii]|uniref:Heptosyltransferase I n=1 Tax=Psittacicella hinzii TaxID=2028575 RepID=A0A3A1Y376_9GAMM|nr:glycosyltransferase family 9 protein [Psittacicella hinzii]RIY32683.1 hypothetical protein CKF54_04300 [Psittacicella hinzii]